MSSMKCSLAGVMLLLCMEQDGIGLGSRYPIVDTAQVRCYNSSAEVEYPAAGEVFFGQDAQYRGLSPSYVDHGDGTVSDMNTGLMWQQDPGEKRTYAEAVAGAASCRTGGYSDWRLPTIKEMYSLIQFNGEDPDPEGADTSGLTPFIDNTVFAFEYGKEEDGDRIIDSQYATSTKYVSTTMGGDATVFGVNFADGRIKGYPYGYLHGRLKTFCVMYVRGNTEYGKNDWVENGNGTLTDSATGLTWQQGDSGQGMNWADALAYAENLTLGGYSDWRLPTAKELQSIVDYTRSPDTTGSAAIDPAFGVSGIINEAGQSDFPFYWTSTTHVSADGSGEAADYIAFGRAMGYMNGSWMDVHGAGCQRSDPKTGDPADYPEGRGPQGDAIRIYNYVRCVRGGVADACVSGPALETRSVSRSSSDAGRSATRGGGPGKAGGRGGFVARLDQDGDGYVSAEEFDGPAEHFSLFDTNGDGYLSEAEAPPPRRGGMGGSERSLR